MEDCDSDVLLLREALRKCPVPADVVIAADGEAALAALASFRPDLIILDLNLPKLSGLEVLKALRNESDIPVAVFTGSKNPADREAALALGAREYLIKPKNFEGYMDAICDILQRWWPDEAAAASTQT